jgi:hypothetical protein
MKTSYVTLTLSPLLAIVFGAVLSVPTASAQSKTDTPHGVVLQDAPIFLTPDASRTPLRVAATGTNLEVLGTENGWLNIRFQDPQYGPRVGYVEAKAVRQETPAYLRPLDLSIPESARPGVALPHVDSRQYAAQTSDPARPATSARVSSPAREGLWTTIGLGYGSEGCRDCTRTDRFNGFAGDFGIGMTVNPRLRLGLGSSGYRYSGPDKILDRKLIVSTLDARLHFYPKATSGFFVTGGMGLGIYSSKDTNIFFGTTTNTTQYGVGAVLGIGWDIDIAKHFSLTPSYTGFAMQGSTHNGNVGQIGLGVTIH